MSELGKNVLTFDHDGTSSEKLVFDNGHWLSPDHQGEFHGMMQCGAIVSFLNVTAGYEFAKHRVRTESNVVPWRWATARQARRWTRSLEPRPDWPIQRMTVMRTLNRLKFTQIASLRRKLLATGDAELVYLSRDRYWGVDHNGLGLNRLGYMLMELRDELRDDVKPELGEI